MSHNVSIFLLDLLDLDVLQQALIRVTKAGIPVSLEGEVRWQTGFDASRDQWDAEEVLSGCLNQMAVPNGKLAVVLTGRDLFADNLNFVFGLAPRQSLTGIVSWYRLRTERRDIFADRLSKEVIHEVGHLEGLEHCPDPSCVMWFSNTLEETDRKGLNFCRRCSEKMA